MDVEQLYLSCLKMVNDKYKITDYPKEKFVQIFNQTYSENNKNPSTPSNDINKQILIKIKNEIENELERENKFENKFEIKEEINIEAKLKEIENVRNSMNLLSSATTQETQDQLLEEGTLFSNANLNANANINNPSLNSIQITNNDPTSFNKFKTFIINTSNSKIRISPNIDIGSNIIYPCCISIPTDIKNKTPYLLLTINDGSKIITYTYLPNKCFSCWDIWSPAIDNYININLNSNNWNITLLDFNGNPLDFSCYYYPIIDVLENNSTNSFSLKINENNESNDNKGFFIDNKIKIIMENGTSIDNQITGINNNRIIIKKNNLHLNNFINATIYNYNNKCSLLFKYYGK